MAAGWCAKHPGHRLCLQLALLSGTQLQPGDKPRMHDMRRSFGSDEQTGRNRSGIRFLHCQSLTARRDCNVPPVLPASNSVWTHHGE
eukprot:1187785-Rhodomonas_salina.1